MPINPRAFGPPTARVQSTGLERLGGPNRPELGGDLSTDRLADDAATFSAMQALPTFKKSDTSDIEPPEFDVDLDDEPVEVPAGLRDPQASRSPATGLERLSRDEGPEGPSGLETAFGIAGMATNAAKPIAMGLERLGSPQFSQIIPAERDYGLKAGGSTPSEAFDPSTAKPWSLDDDVMSGRSGGSVYRPEQRDEDRGSSVGGAFDVATGLMRLGTAAAGTGSTGERVAQGVGGGVQAYQGVSQLSGGGLPSVPGYVGPLLSAGTAAASMDTPEGAAAMFGAQLPQTLLNYFGGLGAQTAAQAGAMAATSPALAEAAALGEAAASGVGGIAGTLGASILFAPAMENIMGAITDAFSEPSHAERERLEANRAIGAAQGMARDVQFATTPEELQAVLDRYNQGFAGHTISGSADIAALMGDPGTYEATIQAGVDPSLLAEAHEGLRKTVQRQAAALTLAQQGHPEALAFLDRQRQAGQSFRGELSDLTSPWMGTVAESADPALQPLAVLAQLFNNDLELMRERAPGSIASLAAEGVNPIDSPVVVEDVYPSIAANPAAAAALNNTQRVVAPAYITALAEAMGLPAAEQPQAIAQQVLAMADPTQGDLYGPVADTTPVRLDDTITETFGLPRGTVLPRNEAAWYLDAFRSGGA